MATGMYIDDIVRIGKDICTRKCAICGKRVPLKERHVSVCAGKWYKRKRARFHLKCFLADRVRSTKIIDEVWAVKA